MQLQVQYMPCAHSEMHRWREGRGGEKRENVLHIPTHEINVVAVYVSVRSLANTTFRLWCGGCS